MSRPEGLAASDLNAELTAARGELNRYRDLGDDATADLMRAWIDALLDEWNRRYPR
ncbi:hypothetical protein [Saccharothrix yanglingensis]|uniref:hypothetical protein n=1 Tax=Saccharothrix yanglingensis TaxID=659496 RepID=UPI0027D2C1FD|nr:hypothetical protein [Saccharothrix yanglingensis]